MATRRRTRSPVAAAALQTPSRPGCLRVDLALQGGGSHGAFTWGVLDRLLQDETLEFGGISGTSAGAMNAVAVAAGLMNGGRDGARATLRRFWTRVSELAPFTPPPNPWAPPAAWLPLMPWASAWQDLWGAVLRSTSPYVVNPLNLNPLRAILQETVDFARVPHGRHGVGLGLPAFRAVHIGDEAYWDGGYAGNPVLLPLVADSASDDLLLVQISLLRDLAGLVSDSEADTRPAALALRLRRLRLHRVDGGAALAHFGADTKTNTSPAFLRKLFDLGQQTADAWLHQHRPDLGRRSSYSVPPGLDG